MLPAPRHVGALCAVSWGAVVLELAYGRMLSVALAPYFAATVITLAVIGRGAGAWLVHALPGACRADAFDRQLTTTMGLLSIAAILSEVMFLEHLWLPQTLSVRGLVLLTAMTAVMAVPAFLSGIAAALVMVHGTPRIERLFGARYAGMALGFVTAVAAGSLIPTPFVPPLVAAIVGWAALIVAADAGTSPRVPATACTIAFLFGLIASSNPRVFRMLQVRQWAQPYTETEAWSADTRIGVFRAGSDTTAAQTLPLARLPGDYTAPPPPAFKWIDVDASNWQPLLQFDGNLEPLAFLRDSVVYAAHHLRAPASVLLVGVGGGRDILAAKAFAQPRIVGLEASALMRDTVERRYDYLSGRPYEIGTARASEEGQAIRALPGCRADS